MAKYKYTNTNAFSQNKTAQNNDNNFDQTMAQMNMNTAQAQTFANAQAQPFNANMAQAQTMTFPPHAFHPHHGAFAAQQMYAPAFQTNPFGQFGMPPFGVHAPQNCPNMNAYSNAYASAFGNAGTAYPQAPFAAYGENTYTPAAYQTAFTQPNGFQAPNAAPSVLNAVANGNTSGVLHGLQGLLGSRQNEQFILGALIGAAAVYVLGDEEMRNKIVKSAMKIYAGIAGGFEEMKEQMADMRAEIEAEQNQ